MVSLSIWQNGTLADTYSITQSSISILTSSLSLDDDINHSYVKLLKQV